MKEIANEINTCVCVPSPKQDMHTTGFGIPADLLEKAVTRLGWLGLLFAATIHLVHWTRSSFAPVEGYAGTSGIADAGLIGGTVLGLTVWALAWSKRLPPRMMLDAGLLFQVAASFCIAVLEFGIFTRSEAPIVGVSGIALWITFFVLVVPTTRGKAALAAVASALMGPLALLVYSAVDGIALPAAGRTLSIILPDLLAAAWSLLLARYIYGMGQALGKARRMGYYELTERLGRGGMGEVWRAKHRMLARPAAIKLISPEVLGTGGELGSALIRRFEKEAQTTATLQSQHTIQLYDFGVTDEGALYYVMEYLQGLDLQTLVDRYGPVPPERAVHFLLQILESLDEAHRAGLVHRDIKPANLFTSKYGIHYDFIKVLDFGLARFSGRQDNGLTISDMGAGTPAFMAPESAVNAGDVDARADLYAVGAVAYWMLTGKPVFEGPSAYAILLDHVRKAPIPPSQRMETEMPPALEQLIMACLEKDPQNRPQTAAELVAGLRAIEFVRPWTPQRAENWWRMHRPMSPGERVVVAA
jgi:hypothetical protein